MDVRRRVWGVALSLLGLVPGAWAGTALAATPAQPAGTLALLIGRPGAESTELCLVDPRAIGAGSSLSAQPVATLRHPPYATARGTTLQGSVLVAVDEAGGGDLSFASRLWRVDPGREPTPLVRGVVHASTPSAIPGTREVLVSRGVAHLEPGSNARADLLTIDAVDIDTGAFRTIARATGQLLYIAGTWRGELIAYRIDAAGAALLAVDLRTGAERVLVGSTPAYARDFSIDASAGAVVFQNRDPDDPGLFVVDSVAIQSGAVTRLYASRSGTMAPRVLPGGDVVLSTDESHPLQSLGAAKALARALPAGIARVDAIDRAGGLIAVSSSREGRRPTIHLVDPATGANAPVTIPDGMRAEIAGFLETSGGAR